MELIFRIVAALALMTQGSVGVSGEGRALLKGHYVHFRPNALGSFEALPPSHVENENGVASLGAVRGIVSQGDYHASHLAIFREIGCLDLAVIIPFFLLKQNPVVQIQVANGDILTGAPVIKKVPVYPLDPR